MTTDEVIDLIRYIIKTDLEVFKKHDISLQKLETKSHCLFACTYILNLLMDHKAYVATADFPIDEDPITVLDEFQTRMCEYRTRSYGKFSENVFVDCEFMASEILNMCEACMETYNPYYR